MKNPFERVFGMALLTLILVAGSAAADDPADIPEGVTVAPTVWGPGEKMVYKLSYGPVTAGEGTLAITCAMVFAGTWIDKGLGMISGGFVPNPLLEVNEYAPSLPEIGITLGVYAIGALVLTVLLQSREFLLDIPRWLVVGMR